MNTRRATRTRAGFTLLELMISLVAGSFVVSGAYYLSDVSARLFNEQMRRAETQMTLRTAVEQLRRDVGRAGYLAVRDTAELLGCNNVPGDPSVSPSTQQAVRLVPTADGSGNYMLFLTGNFSSSDEYLLDPSTSANNLVLDNRHDSFRRSFVNPATGNFMPERFLGAFAADPALAAVPHGRMVSLQDISNGHVYLVNAMALNAPVAGLPSITINPALPAAGCAAQNAIAVAPVSTLRYMLEDPSTDPELARLAGNTTLGGGRRLALVRREIDMTSPFATPVVIAGTARVVLDFALSFRIEATWDAAAAPGATPIITYSATPNTNVGAPPAVALRSLVLEIIAESAERAAGGGAAAVVGLEERQSRVQGGRRVSRVELFMPNMARNPGTMP